ncbi:hypothetical protein RRF57_004967 [Xylaria bambusicola]|uniref:Uncharacterized protein n=1 Tax=Xylaria bambusicola TaxID=326684 RepID=A0AAN7Z4C3_9PEZI
MIVSGAGVVADRANAPPRLTLSSLTVGAAAVAVGGGGGGGVGVVAIAVAIVVAIVVPAFGFCLSFAIAALPMSVSSLRWSYPEASSVLRQRRQPTRST